MNYWLLKSEPNTWSWENQKQKITEHWDGVRNWTAAKNMKSMKKGDLAFFYHSGKEKQIVGIVKIVKEYYPDHTDVTGRFGMVNVKTVRSFQNPVQLSDIKSQDKFSHLDLVRQSRLSVQTVDLKSWNAICKLGGVKP